METHPINISSGSGPGVPTRPIPEPPATPDIGEPIRPQPEEPSRPDIGEPSRPTPEEPTEIPLK